MVDKNILLIEDHPFYRDGVLALLTSMKHNTEEAGTGKTALQKVKDNTFDLVIMDIGLPDIFGPDLLKQLLTIIPKLKILVLSMYPEDTFGVSMLKLGAKGYISKLATQKTTKNAIKRILNGGLAISDDLTERLLTCSLYEQAFDNLSIRKREILTKLASGNTSEQIAIQLNISRSTVYNHIDSIMDILGVPNRTSLVYYAHSIGLVA